MNPWEDPRVRAGLARQLADRRAELEAGARPIGWKVGFGAPASLALMEITAPLIGYLTDATLIDPGDSVDTSGWVRGVVEFEVAVRIGRDVDGGATPAEAAAAVDALAASIELADVSIAPSAERVADVIATNIFHRGLILGEWDESRSGIDISGLDGRITIGGEALAPVTELEAITGRYPEIVATVAGSLAAHGERLRAGELIITGSIIPPVAITEADVYEFALGEGPSITVGRLA